MTTTSGVPPALSNATPMFNEVYEGVLEVYRNKTKHLTNMMQAIDVTNDDEEMLQISITSVGDDCGSTIAGYESSQILKMIDEANDISDQCLGQYCMSQNKTKSASIAKMYGLGAHSIMKNLAQNKNAGLSVSTSYFGPQLHQNCNNDIEVRRFVLQPQWVRPGFVAKTGVGHEGHMERSLLCKMI